MLHLSKKRLKKFYNIAVFQRCSGFIQPAIAYGTCNYAQCNLSLYCTSKVKVRIFANPRACAKTCCMLVKSAFKKFYNLAVFQRCSGFIQPAIAYGTCNYGQCNLRLYCTSKVKVRIFVNSRACAKTCCTSVKSP